MAKCRNKQNHDLRGSSHTSHRLGQVTRSILTLPRLRRRRYRIGGCAILSAHSFPIFALSF
ncbi:hypothetical protein H6P81_000577 [Aristolochia fimbriata]|uniref:Uncharacterized protein n=1 Tax=Aristolochia fimbriata TaxID=158543 RepID=A0AAV7F622_ARIFI|nr:hypothetical protein H6P81_000577 [Aristolochia fimbriata]